MTSSKRPTQRVTIAADNKNFRTPGRRGAWIGGFKSESQRTNFIAAGLRNIIPWSSLPRCTAICKSGKPCTRVACKNTFLCFTHDPTWKPKDPYTPRRQRARAIQAAKRYNAQVYAIVDAEMAMLPLVPPSEYDQQRQAMLRGQLIWIPPLAEWIAQGMPWPPDRPPNIERPVEHEGQSQDDPDPLS